MRLTLGRITRRLAQGRVARGLEPITDPVPRAVGAYLAARRERVVPNNGRPGCASSEALVSRSLSVVMDCYLLLMRDKEHDTPTMEVLIMSKPQPVHEIRLGAIKAIFLGQQHRTRRSPQRAKCAGSTRMVTIGRNPIASAAMTCLLSPRCLTWPTRGFSRTRKPPRFTARAPVRMPGPVPLPLLSTSSRN